MRILNIGSINIDHVYKVEHFVRPGETISSSDYSIFAGGKGYNQSIALARAGADTRHCGNVGMDGEWLLSRLAEEGVDTKHIGVSKNPTGHAIIQVVPSGENAIILYGGANRCLSEPDMVHAISSCEPGDYLLLQNETNLVAEALRRGRERDLRIVFNPAPMTAEVNTYPLDGVDILILNETEAEGLTGKKALEDIRSAVGKRLPQASTVLTMGRKGALYMKAGTLYHQKAPEVNAVDTTAAGDTFIGFFLAALMQTGDPVNALAWGCRAAGICVTRPGASDAIPRQDELDTIEPGKS